MDLKYAWDLFNLYRKIKRVPKGAFANLGWKTITGSILAGLGFAAKALSAISGELTLSPVGDCLLGLGVMFGGIGVRDAIRKIQRYVAPSDSVPVGFPSKEDRGVKIE